MKTKIETKYFTEEEFIRCTPSCRIDQMNNEFIKKLDELREMYGKPIILLSCFRSTFYEEEKGRSGFSAHTEGRAADIRCTNSFDRYKLIECAKKIGFNRIGIGKNYIHIDDSKSLDKCVIWHYYK